jgi:dimethylaniline monooxygenase (N-oxide forming)
VLHSHDYRIPEKFSDMRVLVVGGGPSGLDVALEVASVATKVLFSHHLKEKPKTTFPSNVEQKLDAIEFGDHSVGFNDGTSEEIDAIIFCTGILFI